MRRCAALAAALLLAACAATPPAPVSGWSGKLGYRVEAGASQRAQAGSALFELQGDAAAGSLQLQTALGTALADARWDGDGLRLHDGRESRQFASLEALGVALGETLQGPPLPLAALFDWLRARPWPGAPHRRDGDGFTQLGWQVQPEPGRLRLSRNAEGGNGAMTLTLILSP